MDAGAAAAARLGERCLVTQHVIPRPHVEVGQTIVNPVPLAELREKEESSEDDEDGPKQSVKEEPENKEESKTIVENSVKEEVIKPVSQTEDLTKEAVDELVKSQGIEKAMNALEKCKVVKLRNLAREYDGLNIAGRLISKANKTTLLEEIKNYYNN